MKNKLRHIYHIIFITKRQEMTIPMTTKGMILDQMVQIFTRKGCHVYACNAFLNHVHILVEIPSPTDFAKTVHQELSFEDEYDQLLEENGFNAYQDFMRASFSAYAAVNNHIKNKRK